MDMVFRFSSVCVCLAVTLSPVVANELVINGDFNTDAELFTTWPGYVANGDNPAEVPDWFGEGGRGINPVFAASNPPQIVSWPGGGGRGINPISQDDDRGIAPFRDNGDNDTQAAFMQGTANIQQTVSNLTVGGTYLLNFEYNARNCCGDLPVPTLSINGEVVDDFPDGPFIDGAIDPVLDFEPWYEFEHSFTADSSDVTIDISTMPLNAGDATFLLDNVSLKAQNDNQELISNGDFEADDFPEWPGYVGDVGRNAPFRDNGDNPTAVAFLQGDARLEQDISGFEVGEEYIPKTRLQLTQLLSARRPRFARRRTVPG